MKTLKDLISEKNFHQTYKKKNVWIEIGSKDAMEFSEDFFKLIDIAYKDIGGYADIGSPNELKNAIIKDDLVFFAIDIDPDDDADALSFGRKTKYGFKYIGMGQDGNKQSKYELLNKRVETLKKGGYYVEVSGKIAEIFLKRGVPFVSNKKTVEEVLYPKKIKWFGKHPLESGKYPDDVNGWYERVIGNKNYFKILVGIPK